MAGVALFKILIHTGVDNRFFYYFTVYTAGVLFARHTPPGRRLIYMHRKLC